MGKTLFEQMKFVTCVDPIDGTGGAQNGDWINMENYATGAFVVIYGVSLTAMPTVTMQQATDNAGTSAKALTFSRYWLNAATGTSDALVKTTGTTITKAATSGQMIGLSVNAEQLDVTNGFTHVRMVLGSGAGSATLECAFAVLSGTRYAGDPPVTATD